MHGFNKTFRQKINVCESKCCVKQGTNFHLFDEEQAQQIFPISGNVRLALQ